MILNGIFYAEIDLNGNEKKEGEFISKAWYSLRMDEKSPDEGICKKSFSDWVTDLSWIEQDHIVFVIKGNVTDSTYEIIEKINRYWESKKIQTPGKKTLKKS